MVFFSTMVLYSNSTLFLFVEWTAAKPRKDCLRHSWSVVMWPTFFMFSFLTGGESKAVCGSFDTPRGYPCSENSRGPPDATAWLHRVGEGTSVIPQCLKVWQMGRILVSLKRQHSNVIEKGREQRDQFTKYFLPYLEKIHFTYFTRLMSPASDYKILIGILIRL